MERKFCDVLVTLGIQRVEKFLQTQTYDRSTLLTQRNSSLSSTVGYARSLPRIPFFFNDTSEKGDSVPAWA